MPEGARKLCARAACWRGESTGRSGLRGGSKLGLERLEPESVISAGGDVPGLPTRDPGLWDLRSTGDFRLAQPACAKPLDERLGLASAGL